MNSLEELVARNKIRQLAQRYALAVDGKDVDGVAALFVEQPIPILVGGHSEAAIDRAARLGDGWIAAGMRVGQSPVVSVG